MKDIRARLTDLLKVGYCTPRISGLAKALKEPPATIHYNIRQLEKGTIRGYRAVFDYKNIDQGFCTYAMIHIMPDEYMNPAKIAKDLAKYPQVECIDIVTGDWDLILRVRTKDIDEYYQFVKNVLGKMRLSRVQSVPTMKQIKDEFIEIKEDMILKK
ncbi:MAG: Lrp/AsnC family transcriptional regulator [Candidatus Marsarchaeota archaeon]|nr:Lrp/AsnC family transcriptional regulator [Candidatus Marsarchaeota archaeon]